MNVNTASDTKWYILHGPSAARMCVSIKFKANLNWTLDNLIQQNMWTRQVPIIGARANKLLLRGASLYQKPARLSGDVGNTLTILGGQTNCLFVKKKQNSAALTPMLLQQLPTTTGPYVFGRGDKQTAMSRDLCIRHIRTYSKKLFPFQNTPTWSKHSRRCVLPCGASHSDSVLRYFIQAKGLMHSSHDNLWPISPTG